MALHDTTRTCLLGVKSRSRARERYWDRFDRESHACASCGRENVPLEVHHRDGDYLNNELVNLVAVCYHCHKASHRQHATTARVAEWKDDFLSIGG